MDDHMKTGLKPAIMITAMGNASWIGGLYYKKNILFVLTQNDWILENYRIIAITERENKQLFNEFVDKIKIITISDRNKPNKFSKNLIKTKIELVAILNRAKYIFPYKCPKLNKPLGITDVSWIADFQDCYYPELFSEETLRLREKNRQEAAISDTPLILSSNTCKEDFYAFTETNKKDVYVVPFVSYIETEVKSLTDDYVETVLHKNGLINHEYILVSNQFWPHKNHKVVFDMLDYIDQNKMNLEYLIVLTGRMPDETTDFGRKSIERLEKYTKNGQIKVVGFVSRMEQLSLMRGARFVLQPSLFEGWGTVLEDAKVFDKEVLLSDIPIHREQKNDKCFLFDPDDPVSLAKIIMDQPKNGKTESVESGISRMYDRAGLYSKGFEHMLKECMMHKE